MFEFGQGEPAILDGGPAVVTRFVQRAPHHRPIDAAVPRVNEIASVAVGIQLEILNVQLAMSGPSALIQSCGGAYLTWLPMSK